MRLKDNVTIDYCNKNNETVITKGTIKYVIDDENKYYYKIFNQKSYNKETLPNEQYEFLNSNNLICTDSEYKNIDKRFNRNMYFYECFSENHQVDPESIHNTISDKQIVIVGVGGLGTVILDSLQRMGFKNFTIIDYDTVEESNLNRQILFNEKHLNKNKIDAISDETLEGCKIRKLNKKIMKVRDMEEEFIKEADFLINCADSPSNIENIIHEFSKKFKIPSISGGVGIETGKWGPIFDRNNVFKSENVSMQNIKIKGSNSSTNSIISNFIAFEVMLYFSELYSEYPFYKEKNFNFKSLYLDVI
ncbi:ThiF family adenylyltransferase [Staphylococcus xylosus]|uniref:ThiF family adenylyltransferase n=1 Tax=Staphylococcus xylosus TaxID=1288 RepID=UPI002DB6E9EB|nr:ThiF family adenylyltransferase [Staphylococcus xylosus]MEB7823339.1 ThiF family adenylyltransferase [Staphylococcus xylosus]MEB7866406.1 ThiF family adenylyltransferase [Staphylococcus xylosus]